jgi:FkbM family methyltransferase
MDDAFILSKKRQMYYEGFFMLNQFLYSLSKMIFRWAMVSIGFSTILYAAGEKVPFHLIRRILPEDPIIVEAGAQFGEDTSWMAQFWAKGKIHAFEPVPSSYQQLKLNVEGFSNVSIYSLALSNEIGEKSLYLAGGASSLLRPKESFNNDYFHSDLEHPIEVECTTLDQWAKDLGVQKIDFLWLDMEGNELRMLQAAPMILKQVKLIYTEVNLQPFWEDCVQYSELKNWLESQGFTEIWKDLVPSWHGNALFISTTADTEV